jgi:hypothetical protein
MYCDELVFKAVSHLNPSLIFPGKAGAYESITVVKVFVAQVM